MQRIRLAVFVSGKGSNLQSIMDRCADGSVSAQVAVVVSNKEDAYAITRAKRASIPTLVMPHKEYESREQHEHAIISALKPYSIDLIVLAGYMRVLSPQFVNHYHDEHLGCSRIINIHPALLPKYPGVRAYERAFEAGEAHTGVTVHFVDTGVDTGPIILQEQFSINQGDTLEDVFAKGHALEHTLYPRAVQHVVQKLGGRK